MPDARRPRSPERDLADADRRPTLTLLVNPKDRTVTFTPTGVDDAERVERWLTVDAERTVALEDWR